MLTVQQSKRYYKMEEKLSQANSRKVFQAFPTDPKYIIASSSSSESSITSGRRYPEKVMDQPDSVNPRNPTIAKPIKPVKNSVVPVAYNNEVVVFDVNNTAALHSLIERNGAWFLDVSDLDAMDKESTFQYVAMRPTPHNDLVLTRVPELRHLVYVKFDEEGRPYPIQMRKVSKANYLGHTKEASVEEETKESHNSNSSVWEALSMNLKRSIITNDEDLDNEEPQDIS